MADRADHLSDLDWLADLDVNFGEMAIAGPDAVGMPDLDEIKQEEFPSIAADSLSWPDRKRIGLTYYNGGPYCMFRNEKVLFAGGYEATANPTWSMLADFKSIEQVLRFSRARTRDVQTAHIVLHDLRHRRKALLQKVRIGNRNVADFARGNRFALRRVLRVDLVWLGRNLYLLVQLL